MYSPQADVAVTAEFASAFELLENSRANVFLTGKAGTGKSTFLQYFRRNTRKRLAVVAPTGVAALNVNGQTIHSLFRFVPRFMHKGEVKPDKRRVFKEMELLIIDEISMVRADLFDAIDQFLRLSRRSNEPFGGVQVCVIGDLFQLPPIVSREERAFFAQYYSSPYFFATEAFRAGRFQTVEFTTVHRQNDEKFIHILNAIRSGHCSAEDLRALNIRLDGEHEPHSATIVLTTTNAIADNLNDASLIKLAGKAMTYASDTRGNFGMNGPRLPAPELLTLKVGAQVMFVKNDPEGRWVNGTVGTVIAMDEAIVTVRTEEGTYPVEPKKWQTLGYEFDEDKGQIVEKTLGSFTQFPLMLAWAITIHKSQGKTLERAVIDLGHGAFAPGQLYVALSRCKTLEGITLKRPITANDTRCDRAVVEFMQRSTA
ncbi:MAG TPA: AAA family ATPase [Rickettsiales bacterium]|nr:AAA family ATPase [Rickettsiales bacterium]